ncbi:MAG TPA: 50S ribosomal protein L24 [Candidatus Nanoarchaeia archaeon]|nr:50S ribosomal protein L24 [Candidatus Nanoarchaeia archaeon]
MKTEWSKHWKSSIRPSKQRKYRYNAPLHIQQKFMDVHLSPELRKKYGIRHVMIRKGDKVKIVRGQYKKKTGKILKVLILRQKVHMEGIEQTRKDGTKSFVALQPTNLMILELDLTDKIRKEKLEKKTSKEKK